MQKTVKTHASSLLRWRLAFCLPGLGLALCLAAWPARSQTSKPDAAEAAAAMERAQRIAANPMRMILQAGKINRKPPADDNPTMIAPRAAAPVVIAAALPVTAVQRLPTAPATTAPEAPAEPVYDASARVGDINSAPSPALARVSTTVGVSEQLLAAAPAMGLVAPFLAPKIKRMVEPSFPANVQDELARVREVTVKFIIATDGTVSEVAVQQPAPRQLARHVQNAVAQWLFEPIPAAHAHSVQLVFGAE
jgi:Gram-negative bacterial TonB protein C-terminal